MLSANDIEAFALNGQIETATIDPSAHIVSVTVPEGTLLSVAPIMLTVSEGATVEPGLLQARDFGSPVQYTVTSGNGTEQVWTVTASVLTIPVVGGNDILAFELPGQNASDIDTDNRTVTVNVPDGTDLNVAPSVMVVSPDATVDPAINIVRDFSSAVTYTVTAENGTQQEWTVNVTVSAPTGSDQNAITAFEFPGQTDVDIDGTTNTVIVTVPDGTNLNTAPSVLNISPNATVTPAIGDIQDFSQPVAYTVTAENTDERVWTVNVTVTENQAPIANDDTTAVELGETVRINVIDNDSDVDNPNSDLVISGVLGVQPENAGSFTIDGQEIVFTSSGDYTGDATFGYTINDGNPGNDDSAVVTVTIAPQANAAPLADAGPDQAITLPTSSVTLDGSGSSDTAPGTIASYAWTQVSGPTTATIAAPGSASTSVTGLTEGNYTFRLTVTDDGTPALSDTDDIVITVGALPNVAPVADAGPDQAITLPASSVTLDGSGSSDTAPGTIASYAWTQVSGPTTATIAAPGSASTSVTGLTEGNYTFRLTVTDDGTPALSDTDDIVITVGALPNVAPVADAGPDQAITLPASSVTLDGSGSSDTAPGTIASYAWTQVSGPTTATIAAPGSASTSVTGLTEGNYTFRLTVTDDGTPALSDTDDIVITVGALPNVAPVADAGPDQAITLPASSVTLDGSGSSDTAPGTIASYAWTQVSGPTTATISAPGSASTSVTGLTEGNYTFRLTVTDDGTPALSDTDDIVITVGALPNVAPVADAGPDQAITLPASSVTLNGSGSNDTAPGTIASYAWAQVSGPTTATIAAPGSASTSVTGLTEGSYTFRLTVTDDGTPSLSDTDDIVITVGALPNVAPVADAGPDQSIILPTSSVTLNGSGSNDTAPGTIASYAWAQVSGPTTATIAAPGNVSTSVTGLAEGSYTFRLTVMDDGTPSLSDTDDIDITVGGLPNVAPVADAGPDQAIALPASSVTLDGSGSSDTAPGAIASYAWSQVSGPTTATIAAPGSTSTSVTGLAEGSYTFRLTVTDDGTPALSDTDDIIVTVEALVQTLTLTSVDVSYNTNITSTEYLSGGPGELWEDYEKHEISSVELVISNVISSNNNLNYLYIDGVRFNYNDTGIIKPIAGFLSNNETGHYEMQFGFPQLLDIENDFTDSGIMEYRKSRAGTPNIITIQIEDTNGILSNIIQVNTPSNYGFKIRVHETPYTPIGGLFPMTKRVKVDGILQTPYIEGIYKYVDF
ncbi:PKD domain-containing protein [Zobellia alginiliquefaciens]|uniref:PKD domain-containing protein n=1 Tax=Zobellia alginiliquefaciens TaxID=3032586 RepID=UPI0023E40E03|nr:Ig-like domain-containing protein [Zobellia alginiliquefaciens]